MSGKAEFGWQQELRFDGGHTYFVCTKGPHTTRIGVDGESGCYPDEAEGVLLFLDLTRAIEIGNKEAHLPVRGLDGLGRELPLSITEAISVAFRFGLRVRNGRFFLQVAER